MTRTRPANNKPTRTRKKTGPKSKCTPQACETAKDLVGKLGARVKELAAFFDVHQTTIEGWIKNNPAFASAVNTGKAHSSLEVARSLYEKAIGYSYMETQLVMVTEKEFYENGKVKSSRTVPTMIEVPKQLPPDAYAGHKFLTIIQREIWADVSKHQVDHLHSGEIVHKKIEELSFDGVSEPIKNLLFDVNMKQLTDDQRN